MYEAESGDILGSAYATRCVSTLTPWHTFTFVADDVLCVVHNSQRAPETKSSQAVSILYFISRYNLVHLSVVLVAGANSTVTIKGIKGTGKPQWVSFYYHNPDGLCKSNFTSLTYV